MRPVVSHTLLGAAAAAIAAGITVAVMYGTLNLCKPDDDVLGAEDPLRPAYHYAPRSNWVNDPNGLVYYKGEFHLFYQYDKDSNLHGKMSWGHAVSTDLVHWKELDVALFATAKEQIFSGSAVVDWNCTSGLCATEGHPVLVAIYTSYSEQLNEQQKHNQTQHIASSTDLGRTWTKYPGNPVLDVHDPEFRDPKVHWYGDHWLMLVQLSNEHVLNFYKSVDLKSWNKVGTFGPAGNVDGVWECPDMFPLPVDGDPNNVQWVLIVNINPGNRITGSAGQFFIGDFDGTQFHNTSDTQWLDWGMDNYATITWDNAPNGERISIGWMSNWNYTELAPASKFRNAFTSPRLLKLKTIEGVVRLTQMPVAQLDTLRRGAVVQADKVSLGDMSHFVMSGRAADIDVTFVNTDAMEFGVRVHAGDGQETLVGYDVANSMVFIDRTKSGTVDFHKDFPGRHSAPMSLQNGKLKLRVLVDQGSVEVFAGDGEIAITDVVFPDPSKDNIEFYAIGGTVLIESYSAWRMARIF